MGGFKNWFLVFFFLAIGNSPVLFAQTLINGDLEGSLGGSGMPSGWIPVPFDDPDCYAGSINSASPDLNSALIQSSSIGFGLPYSGLTFVSGQYYGLNNPPPFWHEGIMQEVEGFTPDDFYLIEFFQGVVKNEGVEDTSGTWIVYKDFAEIGVTEPTTDLRPYENPNVLWEHRCLIFQASESQHNLKFLPLDDDNDTLAGNPQNALNGLRMGIDKIDLRSVPEPWREDTLVVCANAIPALAPNLVDTASYLWSTGETSATIISEQTGMVRITQDLGCASFTDSIYVEVLPVMAVDLGADTVICDGESLPLNALNAQGSYLWNTGEDDFEIIAEEEGFYWVEVSGPCYTVRDSINIMISSRIELFLGNDTTICDDDFLLLNAFNPNATYLWQDGSTQPFFNVNAAGNYSVIAQNEACSGFDEIEVLTEFCGILVNIPNIITPNGDGLNDNLIGQFEGIVSVSWEIHNRWGNLIHSGDSNSVGSEFELWSLSHDISSGTYYLIFHLIGENGKKELVSQTLTVTR